MATNDNVNNGFEELGKALNESTHHVIIEDEEKVIDKTTDCYSTKQKFDLKRFAAMQRRGR